ncbi:isocitrate lyase/PEP mutase family protein [Bradyrhizobium sp. RDT10]
MFYQEMSVTSTVQAENAAAFFALHRTGCFVIPNAWDVPSALICFDVGFAAVATTSVGVAFSQGLMDGEKIGRGSMLAVAGAIARRLPVPVTADLESGYGATPDAVADTVRGAIAAGLVGCNLEDSDIATGKLLDVEHAADRIRAAVEASSGAGLKDFVVNARTDPFFVGQEPKEAFPEAVTRANLYLSAGARCAFVPGPGDVNTARALAKAIDGPLNLMAGGRERTASIAELAGAGVRRVSLGGSLMGGAYGQIRSMLNSIKVTGGVGHLADAGRELQMLARLLRSYP